MAVKTTTPQDEKMTSLLKETKENEAFIRRIKGEVTEEIDNLNNPVPLFQQLQRN